MKSIYRKYLKTALVIWSGCLVLLLFAHVLFLSPHRKARKDITRQLAEKKQIYESAASLADKRAEKQLSEEIMELKNILNNFAVDAESSTDLTFEISKIANERGVSSFSIRTLDMDNVKSSKLFELKHISEDSIDIKFEAGFNQFAFLLNDLERHCPAIFVDRFTITRSKNNELLHQTGMNLSVFVRKQKG